MSEVKVGDRVRDIHGKEGVVFQTGTTDIFYAAVRARVAGVEYDDGTKRRGISISCLTVIPKEPIRVGDRVRHNRKVDSEYRRLGGRVMNVNVTGQSVVVLWDGIGSYREELVSQLEVIHRAEKVEPTPMEQVRQLLDTEGAVVSAEIDRLQDRLKALNTAKAALSAWN